MVTCRRLRGDRENQRSTTRLLIDYMPPLPNIATRGVCPTKADSGDSCGRRRPTSQQSSTAGWSGNPATRPPPPPLPRYLRRTSWTEFGKEFRPPASSKDPNMRSPKSGETPEICKVDKLPCTAPRVAPHSGPTTLSTALKIPTPAENPGP